MSTKYKVGDTINGKINQQVNAGYLIRAKGKGKGTVFLPFSQVKVGHFNIAEEAPHYVGQVCDFKVLNVSKGRDNIVVSLRDVEEANEKNRQTKRFDDVKVGDKMVGFVINILDYGAFIDVQDLVGLVHINDLNGEDPYETFKLGEKAYVTVLIKDAERRRINFGLDK